MPKDQKAYPLPDRLRLAMSNEHAGLEEYIEELEPYVHANPDDKWAAGQLRYAKKRVADLAKTLGLAINRKSRPSGRD